MTKKDIEAIRKALKQGDKIELQPTKGGIIINRIRRENIGFIEQNTDQP